MIVPVIGGLVQIPGPTVGLSYIVGNTSDVTHFLDVDLTEQVLTLAEQPPEEPEEGLYAPTSAAWDDVFTAYVFTIGDVLEWDGVEWSLFETAANNDGFAIAYGIPSADIEVIPFEQYVFNVDTWTPFTATHAVDASNASWSITIPIPSKVRKYTSAVEIENAATLELVGSIFTVANYGLVSAVNATLNTTPLNTFFSIYDCSDTTLSLVFTRDDLVLETGINVVLNGAISYFRFSKVIV